MIQVTATGLTIADVKAQLEMFFMAPAATEPVPTPADIFPAGDDVGREAEYANLMVTPANDGTFPSPRELAMVHAYSLEGDLRPRVKQILSTSSGGALADKMAQVKALFKRFGVDKVSDIPAEKYAEFMQDSEALL